VTIASMRRHTPCAAAIAFAVAVLSVSAAARAQDVERFAVVAGNNIGLPSAEPLRYAERDAERMAQLFEEIGGVRKDHLALLEGAGPDELRRALDGVADRAQKSPGDTVLIFYYSGHADSGWLRMGGHGISVTELRKRLELMPTKVRIAIVDACQSGAITRSKGGKVVSPFMEERPVDVEGLVILTSASAAEPAQESDVLRSSFFSHHLMSGLRGPADATGDGTVSALEAYEYAYRFTVQETEGTSGGAQHPTFLYALEGQGDVALTAVRQGRARVELSPGLDGTVLFIADGGRIDAEVVKKAGEQVTVALAPGAYEVRWRDRRSLWTAALALQDGEARVLDATSFSERPLESTTAKGGPSPLGDTPLGGGATWTGAPGAVPEPPATPAPQAKSLSRAERRRAGPLSKREGARLWPAASLGASMLLPGLAHGVERRYAQATLITGLFLVSAAGAALVGMQLDDGDDSTVYGAEFGGASALAFTAFYTYAYAAIDAFYYDTRGGAGAPDPSADEIQIEVAASPLLARTADGLRWGTSYGLGVGVPVHEHVVVGLRDLSVYPNPDVTSVSFSPDLTLRGMFLSRFGWSASLGALMEVHVGGVAGQSSDSGFSAMPYAAGAVHYFPGRAWSLDFGVRGGWSIGTRRVLGEAAQAPSAFAVEYVGGLTWHH
jgi:hypothetical protein